MGRKSIEKIRSKNQETREKLTLKAMVYFQNNGTKNTMNKIAKELAISKTTIYNHFKTKEELVHETVLFKLSIISDYETVLHNSQLTYIERYRKSMLFFCVQVFDLSAVFMTDTKQYYPKSWKLIANFQENVFLNLSNYYKKGIEKGIFKAIYPRLLTTNDQSFFLFLSSQDFLKKHNISVLDAFNQHYKTKFFGLVETDKIREF